MLGYTALCVALCCGARFTPSSALAGSSSQASTAEFLHGRVVDRRTGQGVPLLWVELERKGVRAWLQTDALGYFEASADFPAGKVRARVHLSREGVRLSSRPLRFDHDPAQAAETSHVLRVDCGPCFALDLAGGGGSAQHWEARLVERSADGPDRDWSWQTLLPGEAPLLRYASLEHEPSSAYHARVELRLKGRDWFGRAPVRSTSSVGLQEVKPRLVQYAAFGGLVIDTEGQAVPRCEVMLRQELGEALPAFSKTWQRARSDALGNFLFEQTLEPGRYHVRVLAEGREPTNFDIAIAEGGLAGYELRVASLDTQHALRGHIAPQLIGEPVAVMLSLSRSDGLVERVLHPLQRPSELRVDTLLPSRDGGVDFTFEALPAGEYELALFALDGVRYNSPTRTVSVPGDTLLITSSAPTPRVRVAFDVVGAGEQRALDHYHALFRVPGWWTADGHRLQPGAEVAAFPLDSPMNWVIYAHGYRPAYGELMQLEPAAEARDGTEPDCGPRRLAVELEPGWGVELWLKQVGPRGVPAGEDSYSEAARTRARQPLAGVSVLADGKLVGESDADGLVRLSLDVKPRKLSFEKPGWHALDTDSYSKGSLVEVQPEERRSVVIWMDR